MNWDAIGAIGEIAGAIAVILTLVYLASQVRYAKNATLDQNRLGKPTVTAPVPMLGLPVMRLVPAAALDTTGPVTWLV